MMEGCKTALHMVKSAICVRNGTILRDDANTKAEKCTRWPGQRETPPKLRLNNIFYPTRKETKTVNVSTPGAGNDLSSSDLDDAQLYTVNVWTSKECARPPKSPRVKINVYGTETDFLINTGASVAVPLVSHSCQCAAEVKNLTVFSLLM